MVLTRLFLQFLVHIHVIHEADRPSDFLVNRHRHEPAWRIYREDAMDYILGYTCFNDVTACDLQTSDTQWTRAKGFNTFAAVGPCIETELDPGNVFVETYLNGENKQRANTSDLIFGITELIHFISHVMTLLPGDVIATGTPSSRPLTIERKLLYGAGTELGVKWEFAGNNFPGNVEGPIKSEADLIDYYL